MSNENNLQGWLTFSQAAKKHHVDSSTLRKAVKAKRFYDHEINMVGKTYLVRESAMNRLYPIKKSISQRMEEAKKEAAARNKEQQPDRSKSRDERER